MKQNMLKNKIENNFKKEVDKMKNEIINEMNLKANFENGDKMTNNLTNEMEERKMTRLKVFYQSTEVVALETLLKQLFRENGQKMIFPTMKTHTT